jgi:hypothetical protein
MTQYGNKQEKNGFIAVALKSKNGGYSTGLFDELLDVEVHGKCSCSEIR